MRGSDFLASQHAVPIAVHATMSQNQCEHTQRARTRGSRGGRGRCCGRACGSVEPGGSGGLSLIARRLGLGSVIERVAVAGDMPEAPPQPLPPASDLFP